MFEGIHLQQLWLRVPFGTRVLTHEPPCWRLVLRFAEAEMMGAGWRFGWWVSSYGTWKRMISNRRSIYLCIILYVYMALLYRWIIRNTFDITQDSTFLKGSKGVPMNQKKAFDLTTTGATTGATSFSAATYYRVPSTPWETQIRACQSQAADMMKEPGLQENPKGFNLGQPLTWTPNCLVSGVPPSKTPRGRWVWWKCSASASTMASGMAWYFRGLSTSHRTRDFFTVRICEVTIRVRASHWEIPWNIPWRWARIIHHDSWVAGSSF